jgi:hypothetical protein
MRLPRRPAAALSALLLSVGVSVTSAQPPAPPTAEKFRKEPPRPGEASQRVRDMRDGRRQVILGSEVKQNKADLRVMAKYLVYPVTDPKYYYATDLVLKGDKGGLAPPPAGERIEDRVRDLDNYILKPVSAKAKFATDQVDYIDEFGKALDETFRELNLNAPATPDFVRVNGGRMLSVSCQSGAPALYPLVTELLTSPLTRPELTVYALHAAGNLLAAHNPNNLGEPSREGRHTAPPADVFKLVQAVEAHVLRDKPYTRPAPPTAPPATPPAPPMGPEPKAADPKAPAAKPADPKALPAAKTPAAAAKAPPAPQPAGRLESSPAAEFTPDQEAVFHFLRRAAVRALAQVRYPTLNVPPDEATKLYPLFTLAKVAVSDVSLPLPPTPEEAAEATLGLCNAVSYRGVNVDVLADAVAQGVANFARRKVAAESGPDTPQTVPWKRYSLRLSVALGQFRSTVANRSETSKYRQTVDALFETADGQVFRPIIAAGGAAGQQGPGLQGIDDFIRTNKEKAKSGQLYLENPDPSRVLKPAPARQGG